MLSSHLFRNNSSLLFLLMYIRADFRKSLMGIKTWTQPCFFWHKVCSFNLYKQVKVSNLNWTQNNYRWSNARIILYSLHNHIRITPCPSPSPPQPFRRCFPAKRPTRKLLWTWLAQKMKWEAIMRQQYRKCRLSATTVERSIEQNVALGV